MREKAVEVKVEVAGIDEAKEKIEKYIEKLKEAKTLADELASIEFDITLNQDQHKTQVVTSHNILKIDEKTINESIDKLINDYVELEGSFPKTINLVAEGDSQYSAGKYIVKTQLF